MKIFKHKKQIDNTFDIVHLSGPKDNYDITESMGTLIYTGKDNKNKYELANIDKFCWAKGETLSSIWSIEYSKFLHRRGDIFKDDSNRATYLLKENALDYNSTFIAETNKISENTIYYIDGSSDTINEQSNNRPLTLGRVPTLSDAVTKNNPKSLYLNGSSYITTPSTQDMQFGTNDFTIDFWVNLQSTADIHIITIGSNGQDACYRISIASGQLIFSDGGGWAWSRHMYQAFAFNLNTWYYIMVRRKNGILEFFVDHKRIYRAAYNINLRATGNMYLGTYFGGLEYGKAYIDQFRMTNKALPANDYYNGIPSNITYIDDFARFNGTSSRIVLPSNIIANFPFTFAGWVRFSNKNLLQTSPNWFTFMSLALPDNGNRRFTLCYNYWADATKPLLIATGGYNHFKASIPNIETFNHICLVAIGPQQFTLYVNGVETSIINFGGSHGESGINCIGDNGYYRHPFDGDIKQVRLFDRALTADEVTILYNEK